VTDDGIDEGRPPDDAATVDPVEVAEEWDEGLAPQRTQLAWGRTGLAVAVSVAVLARRVWTVGGGFELAALVAVGVGALVWLIGMRQSRDLHIHMEPHGLVGTRAFALVASGTLLLAVGAAIFGILLPH
jgi:uncharacterized membrane protein YidH (DUF202 family)